MVVWILILTALISLLTYLYRDVQKRMHFFRDLGIPHLEPDLFFGNMKRLMFSQEHMTDFIKTIYKVSKEAKYVGAYYFMEPVIVLRDLDLIKDVIVKNVDHFPGRSIVPGETIKYKSSLTPALSFAKVNIKLELKNKIKDILLDCIENLTLDPENMIDVNDLFRRYNNDVVINCILGIDEDSLSNPENDFHKKCLSLKDATKSRFIIKGAFPKLAKALGIDQFTTSSLKFFINVIRRIIKTRSESEVTRPDLIHFLKSQNRSLDVPMLSGMIFKTFFASYGSTAKMMSFLAYDLALNIDVQEKLQCEIDKVLEKTDGKATFDDINNLAYLDAVINECMRYHAMVYTERRCQKSFILPPALPGLKPFVVQPEMLIWILIPALQSDPKIFDNPNVFEMLFYVLAQFSFRTTAKNSSAVGL